MAHYYSEKQESPFEPSEITVRFEGKKYTFFTASGVFSLSRLDKGTEVLLKYVSIVEKSTILDLGCGWGPVAVLIKHEHPECTMYANDSNKRAMKLTQMNAKEQNVVVQTISSSALKEKKEMFETVLLNPPQVAGKKVCQELFDLSHTVLKKGGSLQIVARHNKGGASYETYLENLFGNVEVLGKKAGYRVYQSVKEK